MHIQKATMADLSASMDIYASARQFMKETGNATQWGLTKPSEEQIRKDIAEEKCHLCMEGEEYLAVFFFSEEKDPTYSYIEDGAWLDDERPYGVIHRIAVAKRGRGVFGFCEQYCFSRCHNVRIDTHVNNHPMQKALEKAGYTYCGVIYLESGESRIAFQKLSATK